MKSIRFYKIVIATLVVVNLGTLAFIWFGRPSHPPHPGEKQLSGILELTGEAKKKVDALETEHHKIKRKLVDLDMQLHKEMYAMIGSGENSDELFDRIHANKQEIEEMTFDFFDEVAAYCNERQQNRLREFVHTAFEQLRPPPR